VANIKHQIIKVLTTEKYNPKHHCCKYWYKDFCECVKKSMSDYRKTPGAKKKRALKRKNKNKQL
jgi:hypothetical protein